MPKPLLEQLPKIVAEGWQQVERSLESPDRRYHARPRTRERTGVR